MGRHVAGHAAARGKSRNAWACLRPFPGMCSRFWTLCANKSPRPCGQGLEDQLLCGLQSPASAIRPGLWIPDANKRPALHDDRAAQRADAGRSSDRDHVVVAYVPWAIAPGHMGQQCPHGGDGFGNSHGLSPKSRPTALARCGSWLWLLVDGCDSPTPAPFPRAGSSAPTSRRMPLAPA